MEVLSVGLTPTGQVWNYKSNAVTARTGGSAKVPGADDCGRCLCPSPGLPYRDMASGVVLENRVRRSLLTRRSSWRRPIPGPFQVANSPPTSTTRSEGRCTATEIRWRRPPGILGRRRVVQRQTAKVWTKERSVCRGGPKLVEISSVE